MRTAPLESTDRKGDLRIAMVVGVAAAFGGAIGCAAAFLPLETVPVPSRSDFPMPQRPVIFGMNAELFLMTAACLGGVVAFIAGYFAVRSRSSLWRFHVPFWGGMAFLSAALTTLLFAMGVLGHAPGYGHVEADLAYLIAYPAPIQAASLILYGVVILGWVCARDEPPGRRSKKARKNNG